MLSSIKKIIQSKLVCGALSIFGGSLATLNAMDHGLAYLPNKIVAGMGIMLIVVGIIFVSWGLVEKYLEIHQRNRFG